MLSANYEILTCSYLTTKLTKEGTLSSDNPYNAGPGQSYSYAIDHVFSAGKARVLNTVVTNQILFIYYLVEFNVAPTQHMSYGDFSVLLVGEYYR
jgi:hypothetical protein